MQSRSRYAVYINVAASREAVRAVPPGGLDLLYCWQRAGVRSVCSLVPE